MSNVNAWARVGGSWINQGIVSAKVGGQWKTVTRSFVKIDGSWKIAGFGSPPNKPQIQYISNGVFEVSPYDSSLTYEAIFKSGSGSANFNSSNGRFTLTGANSAFDVVARYAPGTPPSDPTLIERKSRRFSCRQVTFTERVCDCRLDAALGCCDDFNCRPCPPGMTGSWGQAGCPTFMCWAFYNGVVCDVNCRDETRCCREVCDVLINEPGYVNSGTEWYRIV